eukprot:8925026-Lingulodinium_polyedra.AAC.1
MERNNARFARRRNNESSVQLRHCATFLKHRTMTRSNRCFAGATARKPHARALHARASFGARTARANARFARTPR